MTKQADEPVKMRKGWDLSPSGILTNQVAAATTTGMGRGKGRLIAPAKILGDGTKIYNDGAFTLARKTDKRYEQLELALAKAVTKEVKDISAQLSPASKLVWRFILTGAAKQGLPRQFKLQFGPLAESLGLKSYGGFRTAVLEALYGLCSLTVHYLERKKASERVSKPSESSEVYETRQLYRDMVINIFAGFDLISSGWIETEFTERGWRALKRCAINPFPTALFEATDRKKNPNRLALLEVFQNSFAMNMGKTNEGVFTIGNLLAFTTYPQPQGNSLKGFAFARDLLTPFRADLESLAPDIKWHFLDKEGRETKVSPKGYRNFIASKIKIKWPGYPREYIERRKARKAAAAAEEASARNILEKTEAIQEAKRQPKKKA